MHDTRDLAGPHLFECDRVVDEDLFRIDVKAIEQNAPSGSPRSPRC